MKHVVIVVVLSVVEGFEEDEEEDVVAVMEELKMASVRSIVGFDEAIFDST